MNHYYEWPEVVQALKFRAFEAEDLTFYPHLHLQFEFIYILKGSITVTVNNISRRLVKDEMCIIPNNQIHSYKSDKNSHIFMLIFEPETVPEFTKYFKNKRHADCFAVAGDKTSRFQEYCLSLLREVDAPDLNKLVCHGYLYILLGELLSCLNAGHPGAELPTGTKNAEITEDSTLQKILSYIDSNYENDISLDTIAKDVGVSKFYISKLFGQKIGCGFNYYLKLMRVNKARRLLLSQDKTILDVSYECGFNSTRTFYRAFHEILNMTPKQYREAN